jgi:DNA invertase Pin-like site-specific DNA recombinase
LASKHKNYAYDIYVRAATYVRISEDQTGRGLGVARQLEDCERLAQSLGWDISMRYQDNDISAFSGKTRPGFEAMLEAMKNGEVGAVLCWHTDRLYRNMKDLERIIEVADANRIEIRTVQGGDLDLSTSAGRMVARILGSVARQESEHGSERRKRANAQKAATGVWATSRRPFGYTTNGEPLEPEATAVKSAVVDVLAGKSLRQVAREWNAAGLRTTGGATEWRSPMVKRVLMNPRYAALVVHQGKVVGPGQWAPIIDEDTHHGIVACLGDPTRRHHNSLGYERRYQGSGIYLCGVCGQPLGGWKPAGGKPRAYACADRHVRRQGEALDDYVSAIVVGRLAQQDAVQLSNALDDSRVDVGRLHSAKIALQARMDELAGLFAEGAINAAQLRRGTAELSTAVESLDRELAAATRGNPVGAFLGTVQGGSELFAQRWVGLSPDIRGKIIDQLMIVTVNRSPRGLRRFDPEFVDISWRP